MPQKKGRPAGGVKFGGRQKGTPNKRTNFSVEAKLRELNYDLVEKIIEDIQGIDDLKSRVKYHLQLLEYCDAKRKAIEVTDISEPNPTVEWMKRLTTEELLKLVHTQEELKD